MRNFPYILFIAIVLVTGCDNITTSHSPFPAVNQNSIEEIRKTPSKINQFYKDFKKRAQESLHTLFSQLSDDELFSLYSAIVAYSMAPYGNSTKVEFKNLLTEEKLDCDNYAILTYYLFLARNRNSRIDNVKFNFIGWDGGTVGNHAQIFIVSRQRSILLDPTIGVAAIADFNSVASGKLLPSSQIIDFSTRTELKNYRHKVIEALEQGLYKPSDLLYYFEDFEEFKHSTMGNAHWPTPGAISLRNRKR